MGQEILIATLGKSSVTVTEVLDKLLGEKNIPIDKVIVIHTNSDEVFEGGWKYLPEDENSETLKRDGRKKGLIALIEEIEDKHYTYKKKNEKSGIPEDICTDRRIDISAVSCDISDVTDSKTNNDFALTLFKVIHDEIKNENNIYLSLAGGRKTMSAMALLAAILFDIKNVYHVLVPELMEKEDKFHQDILADDYYLIEMPAGINIKSIFISTLLKNNQIDEWLFNERNRDQLFEELLKITGPENFFSVITKYAEEIIKELKYYNNFIDWLKTDPYPEPWQILLLSADQGICDEITDFFSRDYADFFNINTVSRQNENFEEINAYKNYDLILFDLKSEKDFRILRKISRMNFYLPLIILLSGEDFVGLPQTIQGRCIKKEELLKLPRIMHSVFKSEQEDSQDKITWTDRSLKNSFSATERSRIENVIRSMFCDRDWDEIKIEKKANEGFSGAQNFWIKGNKGIVSYFVKLGSKLDLLHEKYNFDEYVDGYLHNCAGRVEKEAIIKEDMAGICYTAVGSPKAYQEQQIQSFQGYAHGATEDIDKVLKYLFTRLTGWYGASDSVYAFESKLLEPYAEYGHILPPRYTIKFEEYIKNDDIGNNRPDDFVLDLSKKKSDESCQTGEKIIAKGGQLIDYNLDKGAIQLHNREYGFKIKIIDIPKQKMQSGKFHKFKTINISGTIVNTLEEYLIKKAVQIFGGASELDNFLQGANLNNPVEEIDTLLERYARAPIRIRHSIIHGDLNIDNFLIECLDASPQVWLTDFAKTRFGPTLLDFAKLETDVKTRILGPILQNKTNEELVTLEKNLPKRKNDQGLSLDENFQEINYLFEAIRTIRKTAFEYSSFPGVPDYHLPLIIYNLAAFKFDDLERDGYIPKRMAFISAAVSLQQLQQ